VAVDVSLKQSFRQLAYPFKRILRDIGNLPGRLCAFMVRDCEPLVQAAGQHAKTSKLLPQ